MKSSTIKFAVFVSALIPLNYAVAASFNCANARTVMEKSICSDAKLSELDDELNSSYKDAIQKSGAKSTITKSQKEWLRSYEVSGCKNSQCFIPLYSERIKILKNVASSSEASSKWTGTYARFFNGKEDKDSADLTLIGLKENKIYISGNSIWHGENADQINDGEIDGIGELKNGKVSFFSQDGCTATLSIKDKGIAVSDESGCGGLNVTFNGDYKKK